MSVAERRSRPNEVDILIVDDEDDLRELLELSFLRMGLACDAAGSLTEARQFLSQRRYRLCFTDMRLPDGDGLDLVAQIQSDYPGLPVAVISAYGSIETAIRALKLGAFDFITKPVDLKTLRDLVTHALSLDRSADAPVAGHSGARSLIGDSPAMAHLRTQIDKLARNQAPVFIQGASGTGKEVIARAIHAQGPRAGGPFVPVNCGAISPELMESEFFGHRKGSFTGAAGDKEGLFQAAHGGTLFLDEVADLPLAMQVKLLRAIQERAVRPVGGYAEEPVDVRILSASHRNLEQLVAEGVFRQDLYFRINVITLQVPLLRERREDIPALTWHILAKLAAREGNPTPHRLSEAATQRLCEYDFPGNVRELENLLERACALSDGQVIEVSDLHLPASRSPGAAAAMTASPVSPMFHAAAQTLDPELARVIVDPARWNREEAARRMGLTLRQLDYRLRKWGLI